MDHNRKIRRLRLVLGLSAFALVFALNAYFFDTDPVTLKVEVTQASPLTQSLSDVLALPKGAWEERDMRRYAPLAGSGREVWAHVHLPAAASAQPLVAEIANPYLRQVDFFLLAGSQVLKRLEVGNDRPFAAREFRYGYHSLRIPPGTGVERDLYIRVASEITLYLPLRILSEAHLNELSASRHTAMGLFLGLFFGLSLYNLCLCASLRDRVYYAYFAYEVLVAAIICLYVGYSEIISPLLGAHYDLSLRLFTLLLPLSAIVFCVFLQSFLELKANSPLSYRLTVYFCWIIAGFMVTSLAMPVYLAIYLVVSLTAIGMAIVLSRLTLRLEHTRVLYVFLSFGGLVSCQLIHLLNLCAILPTSFFSESIATIGGVYEAIFLALAMAGRIRTMQDERQTIIRTLKGHSPASELNAILGQRYSRTFSSSEINVSIMFIDIVGFSQIADILGSQQVLTHLSRTMRDIDAVVKEFKGTVDRSLGDGVLCFFGYESGARFHHHANDAFQAAKKIQEALVGRFQRDEHFHEYILPVRIGIHVADVLIGDLGGLQRIDFTMIGSGVNFASRLENACSPFKIMISEECHHHLTSVDQADPAFSRVHVAVKHQANLVRAFEFNPFHHAPARLDLVEKRHLDQINIKPHESRFEIGSDKPITLESTLGKFRVLDFSSHGFRVVGAIHVGQKASLLVQIKTFDDATNAILRGKLLHELHVEVRWSRARDDGFEHGLRLQGLNPDQRQQIFTSLTALFSPEELTRHFHDSALRDVA